ncbi:MAG: Gx transporter family protein [Clostridia bacterium]|nr:Gx transporter family protein [Clostridia bacterium]MBR6109284.1 Gx transporter family protein [Clostridia bacterium]
MKATQKLTLIGVSIAAAMVLSYVETLIPVPFAVPGIKLGLANTVALFLLFRLDWKAAGLVSLIRVLLSGLLFGNAASLAYSAAGAALSLVVMALLKKTGAFSPVGISVSGAVAHNVGQILMAVVLLGTDQILWWLPALAVSGIVTGLAIGAAGAVLIKKISIPIR